MLNKKDNIEDLFSNKMRDTEITPNNNIWDKLESNLDKKDVEGVFQNAFQNATIQPSSSIWNKISKMLAIQSFFTFKFNTFNFYYASIFSAIVGLSIFHFIPQNNDKNTNFRYEKDISASSLSDNAVLQKENNSIVDNVKENHSSKTTESKHGDITSNATISNEKAENQTIKQETAIANGNFQKENSSEAIIDWSKTKLTGAGSICENVVTNYTIDGLPYKADIKWDLPKTARKKIISDRCVSIIWQEAGKQTIKAIVNVGKQKKSFELPVMVETVTVPVIKGKTVVCKGSEKQLYSIDETVNKEISYIWESQQNTIHQIGNKYVQIDWSRSGKDTLTVTKINNVTGCKSQTSIGILVNPAPKIDFEYHPINESDYEFNFTAARKKSYTYEWQIEGVEYDEPNVVHSRIGSGSSFAVLTVTDNNRCVSTIQKEVDFYQNFILVPSVFKPTNGKYLTPVTNAEFQSYKMEIYNARNEKIWESTELMNGKPSDGWDGKYRGANMPRGKYMWKISATFNDGTQWKGLTQPNGTCRPSGIFVLED